MTILKMGAILDFFKVALRSKLKIRSQGMIIQKWHFYLPNKNFIWLLIKWLIFRNWCWPSWKWQPYWIFSEQFLGPYWKFSPKESSCPKWHFYLSDNNFIWLLIKWLMFYITLLGSWKWQPYWIFAKWLLGPNWKLDPKESSCQKWHFCLPGNDLI